MLEERCRPDQEPGVRVRGTLVNAARERGTGLERDQLGGRLLSTPILGVTRRTARRRRPRLLEEEISCRMWWQHYARTESMMDAGSLRAVELQLEDIYESGHGIAVLLNLEPDHLDRHGTGGVLDAKLRIFENQGPDVAAVVPRGSARSRAGRGVSSSPPTTLFRPSRGSPESTTARTPPPPWSLLERLAQARSRSPSATRVPRSAAPPRGGRGDQRRALRQRLEGDQRFGCAAGDRVVRRAVARDPRRARQERELRRARGRPPSLANRRT